MWENFIKRLQMILFSVIYQCRMETTMMKKEKRRCWEEDEISKTKLGSLRCIDTDKSKELDAKLISRSSISYRHT